MKLKSKKLEELATLLPEGVSESTINKIVELVASVIEEEVNFKKEKLQAKVTGFIRLQLDELKEQALKELELENNNITNLKVFEEIKSLMSLVTGAKDEESAVSKVVESSNEVEKENEILISQLTEAIEQLNAQEAIIKKLSKAVKVSESTITSLKEENTGLKGSIPPKKPSDKAKVYALNLNEVKEVKDENSEVVDKDFMRLAGLTK